MGLITFVLKTLNFAATVGQHIKQLRNTKANIDGSNIPYGTQWPNLHAGGLDDYVFHGSNVGSTFDNVFVETNGGIFQTNVGGFRTWVGIGTMSDLTTTHKTTIVGAINEVNGKTDNIQIGGRNLIIQNRLQIGYILAQTGVATAIGPDQHDPNYYPCAEGEVFSHTTYDVYTTGFGIAGFMCFYDQNKTFIASYVLSQNGIKGSKTIVAPQNARYYRVASIGKGVKEKLEKGTIPTDWTPAPEDQVSDFNQNDPTKFDYIKNKPTSFPTNSNLQQVTNNGDRHDRAIIKGCTTPNGNTPNIVRDFEGYTGGIGRPIFTTRAANEEWGLTAYSFNGNLDYYAFDGAGINTGISFHKNGTITTASHGTSADWIAKVSNLNNATGIGFANGSFSGLPYFYHPTGGQKFLVSVEYLNAQDLASVTYVTNAINNAVANIPVHNGQLTVNTTADLVGGFTYLPSGNLTTTLGLSTAVLNAIADGVTAYSYGNHATQGYLKITDLAPYETTVSVNNKLTAKQDKLIAGANVSIVGNTISATDTVTRIGVWGGNYTSGDINFTATGAATIVKNGNNINIDVTNSGGIPNSGVEVLNFSPGSHVVNNKLAMTIVRCTSSGTYAFDLQPGKYDGDEICITTCGYECSVGGKLLSMCGTSSFGSSKASRWIWAKQLGKWVQVA